MPKLTAKVEKRSGVAMVQTKNSPLSDAELCRRNGWGPGTRLVGNEGYGPETIRITAVGIDNILAIQENVKYKRERSWTLMCRDWKLATSATPDK